MATAIFSDGTAIPVDIIIQGREVISGSERDFIEIKIDGNEVPYDTVKRINDTPAALDTIQYQYTTEDGTSVSTVFTGFTEPASLQVISNSNFYSIAFKTAKKSYSELAQEKLLKENKEIQLAIVELATNYAELEAQINKEASTNE